jgi:hypothetical protein
MMLRLSRLQVLFCEDLKTLSVFCNKIFFRKTLLSLDIIPSLQQLFFRVYCRAALLEYTAALGELGGRILVLLAKSLGLDPNQFKRHLRSESKTTLRMNHYPPCPHPDKIEGLYAHTDASMISIVHQGLVGGLQILKDDKWVGVRPNPASLVVNIGEAVMVSPKFSLPSPSSLPFSSSLLNFHTVDLV